MQLYRLAHATEFTPMSLESTRLRLTAALNLADHVCREAVLDAEYLTGDTITVDGTLRTPCAGREDELGMLRSLGKHEAHGPGCLAALQGGRIGRRSTRICTR